MISPSDNVILLIFDGRAMIFPFGPFDANLRLRLISALIMAPVVLLAVALGGIAFSALTTCVVIIGLFEWLRLVDPDPGASMQPPRAQTIGIACAMLAAIMITGTLFSPLTGAMLGVVLTLVLFLISAREQQDVLPHDHRAKWVALGLPYMGGGGLALLNLRATPVSGAALTFYLLAVVWGTDIGAFAAGRLIGGPKLAPAISPSKTWAGLGGGIALAAILGYAAARMLGAHRPGVAIMLAPVLAVVAQLGDLFESAFKRRSGVKESGDLIPGHGGVLDRIDGLVFAGIFMALFQASVGAAVDWW
jgi:phosphatidate cytidylyltransferase